MKNDIDQLIYAGRFEEALQLTQEGVERAQARVNQEDPDTTRAYALALEARGDIHRALDNLEAARADYELALEQLYEITEDYPVIGSLHASLGAIAHVFDDQAQAANHWHLAIRYFENSDPPRKVDIATIANNLGFLYKAADDLDSAENCFLRALEMLNAEFGKYDEQTATVFCNLGTLYHLAGFLDQAVNMHMTALDTRRKMLGRAHPDTAQSFNNLALVLIDTGDHEAAHSHFESALKSFQSLGPDYNADLEATLANYCNYLNQYGETEKAQEILAEYQQFV